MIFFSQVVPGVSVGVQGFQGKFQDWENGSQVIVLNSMVWSKTQLLKYGSKSLEYKSQGLEYDSKIWGKNSRV